MATRGMATLLVSGVALTCALLSISPHAGFAARDHAGATGTATPAPTATPTLDQILGPGSPRNVVQVSNQQDGALRVQGHVQLNRIWTGSPDPMNAAYAYSSCAGCQSFAVALQIDLVGPHAAVSAPKNIALAINYQCTGCTTAAHAYQYVIPVSNPQQVPPRVQGLIGKMNAELNALHGKRTSVSAAETAISGVISQFNDLAGHMNSQGVTETRDDGKMRHGRQ